MPFGQPKWFLVKVKDYKFFKTNQFWKEIWMLKLQLVLNVNKWDINSNIAFVHDKLKQLINAIIRDEVMNVHQLVIPTTTNVLPNVHV